MVIGLTGSYCAGKSLAASRLRELGFVEIDVDSLGHGALERQKSLVTARFGQWVLGPDGQVDRRRLGGLVFADRAALRDLEAIVHPAMVAEVERRVKGCRAPVVINAAILFRMGLARLCDFVVCVHAPSALRLARAMRRDGLGLLAAARRLAGQGRVCPKTAPPDVDTLTVRNSGSRRRLFARLELALRAKGAI